MTRVPVGKTIQDAYAFTFGHLGTIIGLIWLPMIVITIGSYFILMPYYQSFSDAISQDNPAAVGQATVLLLIFSLVALVLYAMMYVSVTQEALGIRKGTAFIHIAFGPQEWRMFGALLSLICALAVLMLGVMLVITAAASAIGYALHAGGAGLAAQQQVAAIGKGAAATPRAGAELLASVLIMLACVAMIFVAVRLAYILAAVTVAEERVSLSRGWQLTQGNFWRILAIMLATLLPVVLVVAIAQAVVTGPAGFAMHLTPAEAELAAQKMRANLPLLSGINFLAAPFLLGLSLSGGAFTYRALIQRNDAPAPTN